MHSDHFPKRFLFLLNVINVVWASNVYVDRPRGVPLERKPLYDLKKQTFVCLDNSASIPSSWVNDDYCDCLDGSDEPGTAACPNGTFNCINLGHKPENILSSRVNDQICDCCDGSDEWEGYVSCPNICEAFGKKMREEAERRYAVQKEGYQKLQTLIKDGKKLKEEKEHKIQELKTQKDSLSPQLDELDMVKQVAEKKEKEAKDRHMEKWRVESEGRNKERQKQKAEAAFDELDTNKDERVSVNELIERLEFDKNLDGKVSPEEAQEYLSGKEETERDHFINEIWNNIQHVYKFTNPPTTGDDSAQIERPPPLIRKSKAVPEKIPGEDGETDEEGKEDDGKEEEVKEDEVEDFESGNHDDKHNTDSTQNAEVEEKMPDYDEETKKLMADADQARREYEDSKRKITDIEDEIKRNEEFLQMDLGPNDEFAWMVRQCFEYTDLQYTYKLCMFDRANQKSKDGGSETSLGVWGNWYEGTGADKYSKQMYKNGLTCWNGPARSTEVTFTCGAENKLVGASEPARCEYAFEFQTPAACTEPPSSGAHGHVEL